MSKVIGYLPANIPRILINRTIVHPNASRADKEDTGDDSGEDSGEEEGKDFRDDYVFDAYLIGFCDDVTRVLAKKLFADASAAEQQDQHQTPCQLLATLRRYSPGASDNEVEDEHNEDEEDADDDDDGDLEKFKASDWSFCRVPEERVFLFPGAQASKGGGYGEDDEDGNSEVTFREIAHCDGCAERIVGTIQKCVVCFDYDLCQKCYPKLSKTHYNGEHAFTAEPAAELED
jgi:hypothetical protein